MKAVGVVCDTPHLAAVGVLEPGPELRPRPPEHFLALVPEQLEKAVVDLEQTAVRTGAEAHPDRAGLEDGGEPLEGTEPLIAPRKPGAQAARRQAQGGAQPGQGGAGFEEVRVPRLGERLRQDALAPHRGIEEQDVVRPALLEDDRQGRIRGQGMPDDRQVEALLLERADHRLRVGRLRDVDPRQLPHQLPPNARAALPIGVGEERLRRDEVHEHGTGPHGLPASGEKRLDEGN